MRWSVDRPRRAPVPPLAIGGVLLVAMGCGSPREKAVTAGGLAGTKWQLVSFKGGDETVLTPDDPAKYTLSFESDGRLAARIDCNRGSGTWKSAAAPQLELGPMALTRAMCPPGSLHDQLVKQLPFVRSYVLRDGHLYLSLADGGIYEFAPADAKASMSGVIRGTATYRERMALPGYGNRAELPPDAPAGERVEHRRQAARSCRPGGQGDRPVRRAAHEVAPVVEPVVARVLQLVGRMMGSATSKGVRVTAV
jgi:heat shock protein HslJ